MGAFEILVGKEYPQLMSRVPHILKAFYDNDLLEEEVILEWDDKVAVGLIFCVVLSLVTILVW